MHVLALFCTTSSWFAFTSQCIAFPCPAYICLHCLALPLPYFTLPRLALLCRVVSLLCRLPFACDTVDIAGCSFAALLELLLAPEKVSSFVHYWLPCSAAAHRVAGVGQIQYFWQLFKKLMISWNPLNNVDILLLQVHKNMLMKSHASCIHQKFNVQNNRPAALNVGFCLLIQ